MSTPRVFFSYSHDTPEHKDRVRTLADRLRREGGVEVILDQYSEQQEDRWRGWMREQVQICTHCLMVFTETYQRRYEGIEVKGIGLGALFEGAVISQRIWEEGGKSNKFRVVILEATDERYIPDELRDFTRYLPVTQIGFEELVRWLWKVPRILPPPIGKRPAWLDNDDKPTAGTISRMSLPDSFAGKTRELEDQCQVIPVFGRILPDIPMQENFINLSLTIASAERDSRGFVHQRRLDFCDNQPLHPTIPGRQNNVGNLTKERKLWNELQAVENERLPDRLSACDLYQNWPRAAVLGLPGAGKTTILRHFAFLAFREKQRPLVFFISCRSLRTAHFDFQDDFARAAAAFLFPVHERPFEVEQKGQIEALALGMQAAFQEGQLCLLIDAYDETPNFLRDEVAGWINTVFQHMPEAGSPSVSTGQQNRLYVSARRHEIDSFTRLDAPVFEVNPLDMEQMRDFAQHIFGDGSATYRRFDEEVWRDNVLQRMGRTPLTALLLLCYFDIRGSFHVRWHTYDLVLKFVLLGIWDSIKTGATPRRRVHWEGWFRLADSPGFLDAHPGIKSRYDALSELSWHVIYQPAGGEFRRDFTDATLRGHLAEFLERANSEAHPDTIEREVWQWVEDLRAANLLIATGPDSWVFIHSTVMEYLAARHLVRFKDAFHIAPIAGGRTENFANVAPWLETLPIACGNSPETNVELFGLLQPYFRDATGSRLRCLFQCLAEAQMLEYRLLAPLQTMLLRNKALEDIRPAIKARAWVCSILAAEIRLSGANSGVVEAWQRWFEPDPAGATELRLRGDELGQEPSLVSWWRGEKHELSSAEEYFATSLFHPDLLEERRNRVFKKQERARKALQSVSVKPILDTGLRLLDLIGDPEDKNPEYYRAVLGCGDSARAREFSGLLGCPNFKHGGGVNAVAYSTTIPALAASACDDWTMRLWDTTSGRELCVYRGHEEKVLSCVFSPDGKYLLSGSSDKTLRLWNTNTGETLCVLRGHRSSVNACAFSPDGSLIVSASADTTLMLWNSASGKPVKTFSGQNGAVRDCSFSSDGLQVLSANADGSIKLWDINSGKINRSYFGHKGWVLACKFSPDGTGLISASSDKSVKFWDTYARKHYRSISTHKKWVTSCAFILNGTRAVTASADRTLKIWNCTTGKEIRSFSGHTGSVRAFAVNSDCSKILSASSDQTIKLWDIESGQEMLQHTEDRQGITECAMSADGFVLISTSMDGKCHLWNANKGVLLKSLSGHRDSALGCAIEPNAGRALSASADGTLKLWDVKSGKELRRLVGHSGPVYSCAFNPDGKSVASASADSTLKLWDIESGKKLHDFAGHKASVRSCRFSPDGKLIVSASFDKTINLWDAKSFRLLTSFAGHSGRVFFCSFSNDGKHILSTSDDNNLKLWKVLSAKNSLTFVGHKGTVRAGTFSPDGLRVLSVSEDNTLKLWDSNSGRELRSWNLPCAGLGIAWRSVVTALPQVENSFWPERTCRLPDGRSRPIQAVTVALANGTVILMDLSEWV